MIEHSLSLFVVILGMPWTASAQGPPDPKALIAAQREAMVPLAYMDGIWRGPAGQKDCPTLDAPSPVTGLYWTARLPSPSRLNTAAALALCAWHTQ